MAHAGLRKAAIFIDCLDAKTADLVLDRLPREYADQVRSTWMALGRIPAEEREQVIREFMQTTAQPLGERPAGSTPAQWEGTELILQSSVTSPANEKENNDGSPPFRLLREAEADKLVGILQGERPQTIALVLAHLPPHQAGAVLVRFPPAMQVDIIRCLISLEETDPEVLREVDRALESKLSQLVAIQRRRIAGITAVNGIVHQSQEHVSQQILDNLANFAPDLAERLLPSPRIDFNQFIRLDESALATIFERADDELVVLSLWGAPLGLVEKILQQFPTWRADAIRRELSDLGPVRLSDVEEARRRLAEYASKLAACRRIRLPPELQSYPVATASARSAGGSYGL